jgi:SET domain-containing protein
VRPSGVHGCGAFATRKLPVGATIGSYAGRRYTEEEVAAINWDPALTYLFGLSDGTLIDGAQGGNATRHLNHACDPNCEAVEVRRDDDTIELWIQTTRWVDAGEELFIDYALTVEDGQLPSAFPCHCLAENCRGTLLALDSMSP